MPYRPTAKICDRRKGKVVKVEDEGTEDDGLGSK